MKRVRVALSGADVISVDAPADGSVFVEVWQMHKDFRSDDGANLPHPEVVWPPPPNDDPPRVRRLKERIDYHGEGRLQDMDLDMDDPAQFLLVQSEPDGKESWYVLLPSVADAIEYIKHDYPTWDFEELIDLDTGQEYNLRTEYSFTPAKKVTP